MMSSLGSSYDYPDNLIPIKIFIYSQFFAILIIQSPLNFNHCYHDHDHHDSHDHRHHDHGFCSKRSAAASISSSSLPESLSPPPQVCVILIRMVMVIMMMMIIIINVITILSIIKCHRNHSQEKPGLLAL